MYHVAHKKYAYYDTETKEMVHPDAPNSYKFELFLHNFLPMCKDGKVGAIKVDRSDEFAPIKNASGGGEELVKDSPEMAEFMITQSHLSML